MLKPNPEEQYSVATIVRHKNITWEKLAKALDGIQGCESAAKKIKDECTGNSTMLSKCVWTDSNFNPNPNFSKSLPTFML